MKRQIVVRRPGTHLVLQLPDGYDDRTTIRVTPTGDVLVVHPTHPPLVISCEGHVRPLL